MYGICKRSNDYYLGSKVNMAVTDYALPCQNIVTMGYIVANWYFDIILLIGQYKIYKFTKLTNILFTPHGFVKELLFDNKFCSFTGIINAAIAVI